MSVIVTVVEAGPLEKQVCLLVESLRRWGGRLANAEVFAVKPRRGPELSTATRTNFDRLQVEYCFIDRDDGYEWFAYLNKTAAIRHVAAIRSGTSIIWLDADTLVVGEPSGLLLDAAAADAAEFAACASDKNIGTSRDDDQYAPYFRAACSALGVDYASLPYVTTQLEQIPIRSYWNSGVYAFRADTGLAALHHDFTMSLVTRGVGSRESKLFFSDQIALGLAAHHLSLRTRCLGLNHNFNIQPDTVYEELSAAGPDLRIVHYHGCMWPAGFEGFCAGLDKTSPEVAAWLRPKGPLQNTLPPAPRIHRKLLELIRKRRLKTALREATLY
jgi:hypothetical protein